MLRRAPALLHSFGDRATIGQGAEATKIIVNEQLMRGNQQLRERDAGVAATVLDPRLAFTCLTALLKGAQSPALPAAQPEVYERLLEVLLELAAAPVSSEAALDLLRQVQLVPMQLGAVVSLLGPKQVESLPHQFPHLKLP